MSDERYDLTATMPAGSPPHEVLLMVQGLLTDRFRLVTHRETKELTVYALVVDRNGLKLKPSDGFGGTSVLSSPKGRSLRANITMKGFAGTLSGLVDKPVIDMTGLTGGFNINLEWAPEGNDGAAVDGTPGTTIYVALHEVA